MKKTGLILIVSMIAQYAVSQITAKIDKKTSNMGLTIVCTLNNNFNEKVLITDAWLIGDKWEVLESGESYITFEAYDTNNVHIKTSDKIPFTFSPIEPKRIGLKINANQSLALERLLFSGSCFNSGIFDNSLKSNIKQIKAIFHVQFCMPDNTDTSLKDVIIESNLLSL